MTAIPGAATTGPKRIFTPHPELKSFEGLMKSVEMLQELARRHKVKDIFQDNGGKLLQIALITGLKLNSDRMGTDATDASGREYEIKTVNVDLTKSFSTHHHMNPSVLAHYRKLDWIFALYSGITLRAIYHLPMQALNVRFKNWEEQWKARGGKDLNNPKIAVSFVKEHGTCIYGNPNFT